MFIPQEWLIQQPLAIQEKIRQAKDDPESLARIIGPALPSPAPKIIHAFSSRPKRSATPPRAAKPVAAKPRGLEVPRDCTFGVKEQRLCKFLDVARKSTENYREVRRIELVMHVWGVLLAGCDSGPWFGKLRGLCAAVNRKLKKAGSPLRIYSLRDDWLILQDRTANPPPPKNERPRLSQAIPRRTARLSPRRRGMALEECTRFLRECLEQGINRSVELDRLCLKERACTRRTFFNARRHLGLKARKTSMTGGWVVVPTTSGPSARMDEPRHLTGGACETLRPSAEN